MFDMYRDIPENMAIIKSYLGYDISWYIGYSGATTQILYGMATDEPNLNGKIQKAILLAPCTIPAVETKPPGALEIFTANIDVYEFSGPNWRNDKEKACTVTSAEVCYAMDQYDGLQSTSVISNVHLA